MIPVRKQLKQKNEIKVVENEKGLEFDSNPFFMPHQFLCLWTISNKESTRLVKVSQTK